MEKAMLNMEKAKKHNIEKAKKNNMDLKQNSLHGKIKKI